MPRDRREGTARALARLRHLVVVVPGIGGSVLERGGTPVWGQGALDVAARALNPDVLARYEGDGIRATGVIKGPAVLPGLCALRAYDGLVDLIRRRFTGVVVDECHPDADPVPGANVLLVPYDFRQGVVDCAEHVARTVAPRLEGRQVVVIAHSMGGLLARWWLGPGGGGQVCDALLTMGTPHRGAPKALDWLVNGVRLKGFRLGGATAVVRSWPAAYDLLPGYEAVLETATGRRLRPHELVVDGFDHLAARRSFDVHGEIAAWWDQGDGRPPVTPLLGRLQPTPGRATLAGGALRVEKRDPEWLPIDDWAGDGTVPYFSAVPLEGPETGARLWLVARGATPMEVELHANAGGRWAGEIAGLAPGTWELELSGPGRAGGEARVVREMVAVVEG